MMRSVKVGLRWLLAAAMVGVGISHFTSTDSFALMMPPMLPWPVALIYVSGAAEILGGVGLLVPATRRAAALGLIALYVAVFPANVYQAWAEVPVEGFITDPALMWLRLPFQLVFIAWAWWVRADGPEQEP